jgi:hypothetical protein
LHHFCVLVSIDHFAIISLWRLNFWQKQTMLCTFCAVASVDVDKIPLSADVDPRQIMEILRSRGVEIMQGVYPALPRTTKPALLRSMLLPVRT